MLHFCKENLQEIKSLLNSLSNEQYTFKSKSLSGATIAEHTRHILEFYVCLMNGYSAGIINYDKRERDFRIQSDIGFAMFTIDKICSHLNFMKNDKKLILSGNFSSTNGQLKEIETTSERELAYCLEHSIHHQALIKIGLLELNLLQLINENFGVAPATIRYKEKLAV